MTGEELDRFDRATRAAPGQIVRARRLRAARQDLARETPASSSLAADRPAATPSQPSPVEGEGFANHPVPNTSSGTALWRARHRWVRDDEN
ncbi:hypothetical protein [Brevundimonas viscosa]|uniref:Uncharacterized protein n=1 Tax=Brevundimonas viscosa TaxID=871741 RepID=A0A1I6SGA4_9CAUL|nr:hypothetical protein [Brevundimonas viscosa]SFS76021.1 hypothetical protein SAMN05192570_2389 [Brevundimonas viscosa]